VEKRNVLTVCVSGRAEPARLLLDIAPFLVKVLTTLQKFMPERLSKYKYSLNTHDIPFNFNNSAY
jgi:hypothetical protein